MGTSSRKSENPGYKTAKKINNFNTIKEINGNDGGGLGTIMEAIADTPALINRILDSEISVSNIPLKISNWDRKLWDTLEECKGWRLQQNEFTKHCRLVDPDDIRRAWGTKNGMYKALKSLKNSIR